MTKFPRIVDLIARCFLIVFVSLLGCMVAAPQQKEATTFHLSGTWVWTKDEAPNFGIQFPKSGKVSREIVIVQGPEQLLMSTVTSWPKDTVKFDEVYNLDGSGEVNPMEYDAKFEMVSKTQLKKDRIVIIGTVREAATKRDTHRGRFMETYRLSKDGNTMTIEKIQGAEMGPAFDMGKSIYKRK